MKYPVFIIVRDRITPLRELVKWLEECGEAKIILVDNDSTWPATVKYLNDSPHAVIRTATNMGHQVVWSRGLPELFVEPDGYYVVTDPDLVPDRACPRDVISHLIRGLKKNGQLRAGVGLEITDIPESNPRRDEITSWEGQFWWEKANGDFFKAKVDTTFAVYKLGSETNDALSEALRSNYPYVFKHEPWYWNFKKLTKEQKFYLERAGAEYAQWQRN